MLFRSINAVTQGPTLAQPDLSLPFFLQVDASAYATGAILTQKDTRGKHRAVGFLSKTFNEAKRNYDIHDRELLAVFRALSHWRHLLLSSLHVTMAHRSQKSGVLQRTSSHQPMHCKICTMHARLQLHYSTHPQRKQQVRCIIT